MKIGKRDSGELQIKSKDITDAPYKHVRNPMDHKDH